MLKCVYHASRTKDKMAIDTEFHVIGYKTPWRLRPGNKDHEVYLEYWMELPNMHYTAKKKIDRLPNVRDPAESGDLFDKCLKYMLTKKIVQEHTNGRYNNMEELEADVKDLFIFSETLGYSVCKLIKYQWLSCRSLIPSQYEQFIALLRKEHILLQDLEPTVTRIIVKVVYL